MNERIRELAEQATTYIEPTADSGEGWIFDKEKFAELIVRECARACVADIADPRDSAELKCAKKIQEHFGIDT